MKIIHTVYSIPITLPDAERERIQKEIDALTGLEYRKLPIVEDVSLDPWNESVRTDEEAQILLEKFKAISKELRVLLLPHDPSEKWVFYPEQYRTAVSNLINRDNPTGTVIRKVKNCLDQLDS